MTFSLQGCIMFIVASEKHLLQSIEKRYKNMNKKHYVFIEENKINGYLKFVSMFCTSNDTYYVFEYQGGYVVNVFEYENEKEAHNFILDPYKR